jgi:hypothetical protein
MTARIKISQAGLAAGVAGVSRTDGLATGALVTLEDVEGTGSSTFHLLWGPTEDATALVSLEATVDPDVWTFSPTASCYGSYLIELRQDSVPVERRIFGVRTPANHLLIPALNERASRHASWINDGTAQIELSENNAVDFPDAALNDFPYAGWWRSLRELYEVVEFGTGGLADLAVTTAKLDNLAVTTGKLGDLSVTDAKIANSAIANGKLATIASPRLKGRTTASTGSVEDLVLTNSTSATWVTSVGGQIAVNRAALTGAITAPANDNTTAFGSAAAKSVLLNATNGSAVPAFSTAPGPLLSLRATVLNTGLEWAGLGTAVQTTAASLTNSNSVLSTTPTITIPANTLAVGSRFRCSFAYRFVRGATATALNLNSFFDVATFPSIALAALTAAGTYEMRVEGELTILSTGAGGTAMCVLSVYGTASSTAIAMSSNPSMSIDTTVGIAMRGAAQMNTAVANCTIQCLGGHIERIS